MSACQLFKILDTCSQGGSSQVPSFPREVQVGSSPRAALLVKMGVFPFQQVFLKSKIYWNRHIACWPISMASTHRTGFLCPTWQKCEQSYATVSPPFPSQCVFPLLAVSWSSHSSYSRYPNFSRGFRHLNLNFTIELQNQFSWGWTSWEFGQIWIWMA